MSHDKTFWQHIVDSDFAVPEGTTVTELTPELLTFLGSTDITVRDPFGYMIFAQWMIRDERFSPDNLRSIRDQLLANLNAGLGEQDTDSVFLRSFSALVLSLIVYRDNQQSFLSDAEMKALLDRLLAYFAAEKDLRGYTSDKGWAHTTAHTADCFKFIARSTKTGPAEHQKILMAIADKLLWPVPYVYIHGEDERLVSALADILKRQTISMELWSLWLRRFADWKLSRQEGDFVPTIHAPWLNSKNLLRSLYFRLELNPNLPAQELKPRVLDVLKLFGQ